MGSASSLNNEETFSDISQFSSVPINRERRERIEALSSSRQLGKVLNTRQSNLLGKEWRSVWDISHSSSREQQLFKVHSANKIHLEPIPNPFPSKACFSPTICTQQNQETQQQPMRRFKVDPSPRSAMKEHTDQLPFSQANLAKEHNIHLPPLVVVNNTFPNVIIEGGDQSSIILTLPKINTVNTFLRPPLEHQDSFDIFNSEQTEDNLHNPSHHTNTKGKRHKLDEYINMKRCNVAIEEVVCLHHNQISIVK